MKRVLVLMHMRDWVLPLLRNGATREIDTTAPLDEVVDTILRTVES